MLSKSTKQSVLFQGACDKPVVVKFDSEGQSSDGGIVLLKSLDRGLGLTSSICKHLIDTRSSPTHEFIALLQQRVMGIALGYADCNDAEHTRHDPCLKMACGRAPLDSQSDLGSQPMLSRFENAHGARAMALTLREFEHQVIGKLAKRHRKAKLVTIDLDPSCDPTHGQQAFSCFHGFYDTHCYLPQFGFLTIDDEAEQHLFHARLRPGNARCYRGAIPLLRRAVEELRQRFSRARIRVRLDSGFAHPMLLDVLTELKVEYVVGIKGNSKLDAFAEPWMNMARTLSNHDEATRTFFGEERYKARSWKHERRVIIKAEVVVHEGRTPKDNQRFVLTNLRHTPANVYAIYCARGDAENRIKEMKALQSDRTSCKRFLANQLRLLMTAMAYSLFQELRWRLRRTEAACSQVGRLQLMLIKVGARVVASVRRIVMHFPASHAWQELWLRAARAVGAAPA